MHPLHETQSSRLNRFWSGCRALGLALLLFLLPIATWAQHSDDEKQIPLDPRTMKAQLTTFGVIAAVLVAVAVYYYIRRWQLLHSDKFQEGFERDED